MTMIPDHPPTGWTPGPDQSRIVVCRRCQGRGHFTRTETTDYHKGDTRTITTPCACCHGSGRMVSTLTLRPYQPSTTN